MDEQNSKQAPPRPDDAFLRHLLTEAREHGVAAGRLQAEHELAYLRAARAECERQLQEKVAEVGRYMDEVSELKALAARLQAELQTARNLERDRWLRDPGRPKWAK
jgi:chromosome segregation ATPase